MSSTAAMAKRIKELEERLGIKSEEETELPSSHRHALPTHSNRGDGRSSWPTGADQYMDQVVDCESFLAIVFPTEDGLTLLLG
jgi:hypothetical protein